MSLRSFFLAATLVVSQVAYAVDADLRVEIDRTEIGQDESVALKFNLQIGGGGSHSVSAPQFNAPDFDEVNSFSQTFIESYYENGQFGMRDNRQITKVLRPKKSGEFKITGIQMTVDGKAYTAAPVSVKVTPAGAGTPPPKYYGGGVGTGLRANDARAERRNFFLRAEISKAKVYKGEQLIVSYYLYSKVPVFNIQVTHFPVLDGFLKEDLEIPAQTGRLNQEQVTIEGGVFDRALLARYAAYPLKDGFLPLDNLSIKANYYPKGNQGIDPSDPFATFFRQMTPQVSEQRSDPVSVQVLPLPTDSKPASFSGGVGDFSVGATADRAEVKAGEAINLTVKVEGRGNVAAFEAPKVEWPNGVSLYESKGRSKSGLGVGEKSFEFLLIPRVAGPLTLPAFEFSFFDPQKGQYVTRMTNPIQLNVLPGASGAASVPPSQASDSHQSQTSGTSAESTTNDIRSLRRAGDEGIWPQVVRAIFLFRWVALALFSAVIFWIIWDQLWGRRLEIRSRQRALAQESLRFWRDLDKESTDRIHDRMAGEILRLIQRHYGIPAKALSRADMERILVDEKGMSAQHWKRIEEFLERAEAAKFAKESAKLDVQKQIAEGESLARLFGKTVE